MCHTPTTVAFDRDRILLELTDCVRQIMQEEMRRAFPNAYYQNLQAGRIMDIERMMDAFEKVVTREEMDTALVKFNALTSRPVPGRWKH